MSTTKTVGRASDGVPRKPCSGGVSPTVVRCASTTPYCGCSSWNQMTPAITSATTYGTKTIVRSSPRPRIRRLSSSASAEPERQLDQDRQDHDR